ncbi:MAG: UDP-N-acetylmuramate--L-alanine ligase [Bacillota bacterium]
MNKFKNKNIHLIGIGGISMSAIANFLLDNNIKVSGSDLKNNNKINKLKSKGATINIGHKEKNVISADFVVKSSAIPENNPELKYARSNGIKIYERAEILAEIASNKKLIAVSGSHGKTTVTGMLASIFVKAGMDPSIMIGGDVDTISGNYKIGSGDFFITEADESDGSLLYFDPEISIITNIEAEHLDFYGAEEKLFDTMFNFIKKTAQNGVILCYEDEGIKNNLIEKRINSMPDLKIDKYGLSDGKYRAEVIKEEGFNTSYKLYYKDKYIDLVNLNLTGKHNVLNSLAAIAASKKAGLEWQEIINGLSDFNGVKRRFEYKGQVNGIKIIDDYAHHPSEIETVINSAKKIKANNIRLIFQPHRYTRTRDLWNDFVNILHDKEIYFYIVDIYSANQSEIKNINSRKLVEDINFNYSDSKIQYTGSVRETIKKLNGLIEENDLILTVGAGDVYKIGEELLKILRSEYND